MYVYHGNHSIFGAMRPPVSYMRLLHASPGASAVDVYANNRLIASGIYYKGFTEYLQVLPGKYNIKVFPAGTTSMALFDTEIDAPVQSIVTAAVTGISPNIGVKVFFEPVLHIPEGKLYLRFAHLIPDGPDIDLLLSDGTVLFEDVSYGAATSYIAVFPSSYTFYLQQAGTNRNLLYVPNMQLLPGRFYTIYAVGQVSGNTPLQVLVPLDGNSYIQL